jgi:hypothetical protein
MTTCHMAHGPYGVLEQQEPPADLQIRSRSQLLWPIGYGLMCAHGIGTALCAMCYVMYVILLGAVGSSNNTIFRGRGVLVVDVARPLAQPAAVSWFHGFGGLRMLKLCAVQAGAPLRPTRHRCRRPSPARRPAQKMPLLPTPRRRSYRRRGILRGGQCEVGRSRLRVDRRHHLQRNRTA